MKTYKIKTEADRADLLKDIQRVPIEGGFNVACTRRKRSHDQNDLLWGLLSCFAKQAELSGKTFTADGWKAIFMNALGHSSDMLPTLDGRAFFAEGYRSSNLSMKAMTALIESIYAEGAERGVDFGKFTDTSKRKAA